MRGADDGESEGTEVVVTDWPDLPVTEAQQLLEKALHDPLTEVEVKAIVPVISALTPAEGYQIQRALLRANRPWRRALRLHYWHARYLLHRAWVALTRPWEAERKRRNVEAYTRYLEARQAQEDAEEREWKPE